MTREQTITNMCLAFRPDFTFAISEDERMYTLTPGMTERERAELFTSMANVFDNNFAVAMEEHRRVNEGEAITIPKNEAHAKAMLRVAHWYLDTQT
jgi:hypothetical protein